MNKNKQKKEEKKMKKIMIGLVIFISGCTQAQGRAWAAGFQNFGAAMQARQVGYVNNNINQSRPGVTCQRVGNTIFCSDGTTCQIVGGTVFCN